MKVSDEMVIAALTELDGWSSNTFEAMRAAIEAAFLAYAPASRSDAAKARFARMTPAERQKHMRPAFRKRHQKGAWG